MVISKEFIQKTIDFWSPRYGHRISENEAINIIEACTEAFHKLTMWHRKSYEKCEDPKMVGGKN